MANNEYISYFGSEKEEAYKSVQIGQSAYFLLYKVRLHNRWYFKKQLKVEYKNHGSYMDLLKREFEIGQELDHPHIVKYHSYKEGEQPYLLSEYIDGRPIGQMDEQTGKAQRKRYLYQLLSAIRYLHRKGVYHLDLKPDNILVPYNGDDVKLIDLGFAYKDSFQQVEGCTPGYELPDGFEIRNELADRDIYALGLVIKEIGFERSSKGFTAFRAKQRYASIQEAVRSLNKTEKIRKAIPFILLMTIALVGLALYWASPYWEREPFSKGSSMTGIETKGAKTDKGPVPDHDDMAATPQNSGYDTSYGAAGFEKSKTQYGHEAYSNKTGGHKDGGAYANIKIKKDLIDIQDSTFISNEVERLYAQFNEGYKKLARPDKESVYALFTQTLGKAEEQVWHPLSQKYEEGTEAYQQLYATYSLALSKRQAEVIKIMNGLD